MKKTILISTSIFLFILTACSNSSKQKISTDELQNYVNFGEQFAETEYITAEEMLEKYKTLKKDDTINVVFASTIDDVCQKKGCWMTLTLPDSLSSFVKFKDYGFFMPLNAMGSEAIVKGKAFVSIESVQDLKHYAKDEGLSQAEIDKITEPEVSYSFLADGVLIKK